MSRTEIATFLEVPQALIEQVWQRNDLKRTVFYDGRLSDSLAQSSIFDVLEYAIAHSMLPVVLDRERAALWVTCLCEACEWEEWEEWDTAERASQLLAYAVSEGLCREALSPMAKVAFTLVVTQTALVCLCAQNDHAETHCFA